MNTNDDYTRNIFLQREYQDYVLEKILWGKRLKKEFIK